MDKGKILKNFIAIFLILFFIFGCFSIYKFIIINKIFNKMKEYIAKENYHMKIKNSENSSDLIEVFYKDGIGKMIASNGVYTWTDGKEAYMVDDTNKKIQSLDFDSTILISNEYVGSMLPGYSKNFIQRFGLSADFSTSVKIKKYDGFKYYVITIDEESNKTIWINYDSLLPYRIDLKIGEVSISYNYDITFGQVKDEDVQKPNLEEYTVIEE